MKRTKCELLTAHNQMFFAQITVELRKSEVVTSVADHGSGIDDMEWNMIVEKFYRDQKKMIDYAGPGNVISQFPRKNQVN